MKQFLSKRSDKELAAISIVCLLYPFFINAPDIISMYDRATDKIAYLSELKKSLVPILIFLTVSLLTSIWIIIFKKHLALPLFMLNIINVVLFLITFFINLESNELIFYFIFFIFPIRFGSLIVASILLLYVLKRRISKKNV